MNGLKDLIKKVNGKEYTKEQEKQLLQEWVNVKTLNDLLIITIEEISEVIQAITMFLDNNMKDGLDNILEEYVDVHLSIKIIYLDIDKKFTKPYSGEKITPPRVSDIILKLSKAQQIISKYLRHKRTVIELEEALSLVMYALIDIKKLFNIKKKSIKKMKTIKLDRIRNRIDIGNIN